MNCATCKHFNQTEHYEKHLGWCDLEFPSWLYKEMKINRYDVTTTVRVDDTCSFYGEQK